MSFRFFPIDKKISIQEANKFSFPYQIKDNELYPNNKLLSDEDYSKLLFSYANIAHFTIEVQTDPPCHVLKLTDQNISHYYITHSKLGSGSYGSVDLVQNLETGAFLAIKFLNLKTHENKFYNREIEVLKAFNQLHISWAGVIPHAPYQFKQCIVMNLHFGVSLYDFIKFLEKTGDIDYFPIAMRVARNLAIELDKLHNVFGRLHCDLKPENIMINHLTEEIQLIDFQSALEIKKGINRKRLYTTHTYAAPELSPTLITKQTGRNYTIQSDLYAFGIIVGELFNMINRNFQRLDQEAYYNSYQLDPNKKDVDPELFSFLKKLTADDPKDRPDSVKVCCEFFKKRCELLPTKNIGIVDIHDLSKDSTPSSSTVQILSDFAEIWFIDPKNNFPLRDFNRFIKELHALGVKAIDRKFYAEENKFSIAHQIPAYIQKHYPTLFEDYNYTFINQSQNSIELINLSSEETKDEHQTLCMGHN